MAGDKLHIDLKLDELKHKIDKGTKEAYKNGAMNENDYDNLKQQISDFFSQIKQGVKDTPDDVTKQEYQGLQNAKSDLQTVEQNLQSFAQQANQYLEDQDKVTQDELNEVQSALQSAAGGSSSSDSQSNS